MRFDWTDLRVFLHACEAGSMTAAAQRASLTLAAVSARIRALEEGAGMPLLQRHARGVVPTAAGEALARRARVLCQQLDALRSDMGAGRPPAGHTVLLANSSVSARPLHRVVGEVLARHAGARITLRESGSEVTAHALLAGAADVGIVSDAVRTEGLAVEELGADPLVLVTPAGHALASRGGALHFADAFAHDWIAWREDGALHTHLAMQACRAGGALKTVASVPTAAGVVELVARGLGISVLPRALLRHLAPVLAPAPPLAVLELREPWARRRLLVCRRPDGADPVALALFDELRAQWRALDHSASA